MQYFFYKSVDNFLFFWNYFWKKIIKIFFILFFKKFFEYIFIFSLHNKKEPT